MTRSLWSLAVIATIGMPVVAYGSAANLNLTGTLAVSGSSNTVNLSGNATFSPYGTATVSGSGQSSTSSDSSTNNIDGTFVATFSTGALNGTFHLSYPALPVAVGTPINFSDASLTITGGTGYFMNATGSFTGLSGSFTAQPSNQPVSLSGTGSLLPPSFPLSFVPVAPCRVADTRGATGPHGGPFITAKTSRDFPIAGSCGIPATAAAYSLNVTAVPRQGTLSFLATWPAGEPQPLVSTLNSLDGRIKANAAIVPSGAGGAVSVFATDDSDVVLDVNGYFEVASGAQDLLFYPVSPCRVLDTRGPFSTFGAPSFNANGTREIPMTLSACGLPSTARAYSLNVTAVPLGKILSYLTIWPTGAFQPFVSTLNSPTGTVVANAAIVPAGVGNGDINVFVTDPSDVVIDVNGYFAAPTTAGLAFYPAMPCRMLDTRNPTDTFGGPSLAGGAPRVFPLPSSSCPVPANVQDYVLNATVVPKDKLGFLTLYPAGQALPGVSTLNALDGAITSNAAVVPAGTNGAIAAYATAPTDLILDVNGYFGPIGH